jgi:hypothetical protein
MLERDEDAESPEVWITRSNDALRAGWLRDSNAIPL